jgi:type II secretory pathway component PulM
MLEFPPVSDRLRPTIPWLLIAGSGILAVLLAYVLFVGYIPAKRHVERLDAELKGVYAREAALQSRVAELEERLAERDRQIAALRAQRPNRRPPSSPERASLRGRATG